RSDLDTPSLPVVIGGISSQTFAFGDLARQRQLEYVLQDPNTTLVTTTDLARNPFDTSHFTGEATVTLGARFAEAMPVPEPASLALLGLSGILLLRRRGR